MDPDTSPDESSHSAAIDSAPSAVPPAETQSSQQTGSLDVGTSVYQGIQRAIQEAVSAQHQSSPVQRQQFYEPATEAIAAMDLREELFDEIRDIVADAPREIREEVRKSMRQFQNYESLQIVKANQIHKTIAEAAIGRAVREGKYVPPNVRGSNANVSREPVHSEPAARIPSDFRREQEEVCHILGVTLSEAELQAAWRNR